jgi:hypothetical protein
MAGRMGANSSALSSGETIRLRPFSRSTITFIDRCSAVVQTSDRVRQKTIPSSKAPGTTSTASFGGCISVKMSAAPSIPASSLLNSLPIKGCSRARWKSSSKKAPSVIAASVAVQTSGWMEGLIG